MISRLQHRIRGRRLLDRLEHRLAATPDIIAFYLGQEGLRGMPSWPRERASTPDAIAIAHDGTVWLIDVRPNRSRAAMVRAWCLEQTAIGPWQFCYLPLARSAIEGSGAIAFTPCRW